MNRGVARHWPLESVYLRDFEVLEERQHGRRLFPHTEQLPALSRAVDLEFYGGLPGRLAATDARGDSFRKLQLRELARGFCSVLNAARPDHLHVQPYYTPELVAQIGVVQQVSESGPGGMRHSFRQFRGQEFLPDIHLSGKRIVFSTHAIDRFGERAVTQYSHQVVELVRAFFFSVGAVLELNGTGPALAFRWGGSVAVMPFEETANEFFILTTLGVNEVRSLALLDPPRVLHLHYGAAYTPPATRNFDPSDEIAALVKRWREQAPLKRESPADWERLRQKRWFMLAPQVKTVLQAKGYTEATRMFFHDDLHGPNILASVS